MPAEQPRAKVVGRPPHFSLDAIIAAADRILQTEGAEKLSMRRLAKELDSAPMALYYHVRDKDELPLLLMETQAQRIPRPELPEDPRERLVAVSLMLYELLADQLWIVQVLASDDVVAPSALWFVEEMIGAAVEEYGHTPEHAVFVYRTIWFSIVGGLIIRVNGKRRRGRSTGPTYEDQVVTGLTSDTHPQLAAVAGHWAELNARDTHRQGLTAVIDGLLRTKETAENR
ncbi:TetR/AcrR family transcriptional regulator [Streptomyces sp. NPDC059578]|uniref:TetR/AcrR family transcriptional regulator n=1 Tax=Streptomyces sp. NPDC059578 TaxID=3346874 RepID=UPI0036737A35